MRWPGEFREGCEAPQKKEARRGVQQVPRQNLTSAEHRRMHIDDSKQGRGQRNTGKCVIFSIGPAVKEVMHRIT